MDGALPDMKQARNGIASGEAKVLFSDTGSGYLPSVRENGQTGLRRMGLSVCPVAPVVVVTVVGADAVELGAAQSHLV